MQMDVVRMAIVRIDVVRMAIVRMIGHIGHKLVFLPMILKELDWVELCYVNPLCK